LRKFSEQDLTSDAREAMNRWAKKLTIEGSESVAGGVGRITGRPRKGRFRLGPLTGNDGFLAPEL
jgi:hypothetical protein